MDKKIRSKVVRESLLDYSKLADSLKENTKSAVKELLDETVREEYAKLLTEGNEDDYEEEEVEDTTIDTDAQNDDFNADDSADTSMQQNADADDEATEVENDTDEVEIDADADEADGDDEWSEFDKYKVSDDEYDFSNAQDDEIVKVYKLMKDDDQILVHKEDDTVKIQDNTTGAEYLIDLGGDDSDAEVDNYDLEIETDEMNESTERMFELVMEYNSNVGYTDNYQSKDVMTNPGMSEPGKNVNDWDAGVPKGTEKPWSKYQSNKKKADKPFNDGKGKQVEEQVEECGDMDAQIEESAAEMGGREGAHGRMMGIKSHNPIKSKKNSPMNQHHVSTAGEYLGDPSVDESVMRKINSALNENKELKSTLTNVMTSLKEAAVVNKNLAQIIRLISENATSQDEKKEIINRFSKEAKTIEQSENLYESISNDLKKSRKMNITEDNNLSAQSSKTINETTIYKSKDMLDSLDLMHRMMK